MARVAVVGHVEWVDFVPVDLLPAPGQVAHSSEAFTRAAGGGGVVACVLVELGAEVDFYCALGRDPQGQAAAAQLAERGVRLHVAWRDEPTRRALTMLEVGGERTIVTIGARLAPRGADELDWSHLERADGVYFTAGDGAALARARAARALVASPRGRGALHTSGPRLDALIYSGRDRDEETWALSVADRARVLVETDGANGGRWWGESEGHWHALEPPGEPRDSYGCGDSFAAGFTFALAGGGSVADAAATGARCGALCLTRNGAP